MAQTGVKRSISVSIILFCVALALTAYTSRNPSIVKFGTTVFSEALAPIQTLNRSVHDWINGLWGNYINLIGVKEENRHLADRLMVLEAENSKLIELASENERLKSLLNVAEVSALNGYIARVLAYDPTNWSKKITVNRGMNDNIKEGMAVISGNGVVGQIVSVGLHTSQVLLLSDPSSGADAIIQRTRTRGVVEGTGGNFYRLQFVKSEEDVRLGDRVITSGLDGIYPKGLLLGVVSFVGDYEKGTLFRDLKVRTSIDFNKLEDVLIVVGEQSEAEEVE